MKNDNLEKTERIQRENNDHLVPKPFTSNNNARELLRSQHGKSLEKLEMGATGPPDPGGPRRKQENISSRF